MKNVVVIEDDLDIQDVFRLALNIDKYAISVYHSANAFLEQLPAFADLIIVDKNMPGMSGLMLCAKLKEMESYRTIPIVMISADPGIETDARVAGADDVLPKPFKLPTLRTIVEKYCRIQSL